MSHIDDSQSSTEGVEIVVNGNNKFALTLYQHLLNNQDKPQDNIFFSPYSLSTAMAMLYTGAEGETKQQIENTFHYPALTTLNPNSAYLYKQFNSPNSNYKLATSNALWLQQGMSPKPDYANTIRTYYGGDISNLNFANKPEGARKTINQTIAEQTNQMIQNLLAPGSINNQTRAVLTNSVYFKGDWKSPFNSDTTRRAPFYTFDGKSIEVDMMSQHNQFAYMENDQAQMIKLPYKGEDLSMLIILPKSRLVADMQQLVNELTPDMLSTWENKLSNQSVELALPKFKLAEDYKLKPLLSKLGMPKAFGPQAELFLFRNQADSSNLAIDEVIHKAVVEVDEKGTEAAAATAISVTVTSMPQYQSFIADHPFMFLIKDNQSNTILLLGQVNKP